MPDSDVAAIRSSVSHPAANMVGLMRHSLCMPAVRFCCPAYAGLSSDDPILDSEVLPLGSSDASPDVVLSTSQRISGRKSRGVVQTSKAIVLMPSLSRSSRKLINQSMWLS